MDWGKQDTVELIASILVSAITALLVTNHMVHVAGGAAESSGEVQKREPGKVQDLV